MRSALAMVALALFGSLPARAAEPTITPRPLHVADRPGPAVRFGDSVPVLAPRGDGEAHEVARFLTDLVGRLNGPRLVAGGAARGAPAIRLVRRRGFAPEGYALDIDGGGATITASSRAGLLYGAVTLSQLFVASPDHRIARLHVDDEPRFAWRGVLLDSARHFQSPAEIARMLDWMVVHKLNRLQWHLVDDQAWRLEIKRYPRLTGIAAWRTTPPAAGLVSGRYGGFYTQAQVRRIVAAAALRNITIVPEIEMPGHATAAILAYPEVGLTTVTRANLGDWGVFPSIYGVDASSFTFLHGVLDEVMALFPSKEIAIGGDEAVHALWHSSPGVQATMRALGLTDEIALQGWFVGRIGTYLNSHGRRLVGWDEILSGTALAKNDIVLSWHGADGAITAAHAGHDVVMATAPTLYFDNRQSAAASEPPGRGLVVSLADVYGYDPGDPPRSAASAGLDDTAARHVLGVMGALWTEHIATDARLEAMALPRAAALAEIAWTAAARRDWPGFVDRLPAMFALYRALGLNADDGAVAVQSAIVTAGRRARVSLSRQLDLGDLRYTIDGSAPTPTSARYTEPLDLPLPAHLRAASFAGRQRLSRELDLPLDSISATRRTSQQLDLCSTMIPLNLAGRSNARGSPGQAGAYLVDIKNPCWIYHGADLAQGGHVAVGVAALPFNFQLSDDPAPIALRPTATLDGELIVRRGCDGPVLASVPLAGLARDGASGQLIAAIPPLGGRADLCLSLARPSLDPLWALGWVEIRP